MDWLMLVDEWESAHVLKSKKDFWRVSVSVCVCVCEIREPERKERVLSVQVFARV